MKAFPDAKVVLTVRNPDTWYESIMNTLFQFHKTRSEDFAVRLFNKIVGGKRSAVPAVVNKIPQGFDKSKGLFALLYLRKPCDIQTRDSLTTFNDGFRFLKTKTGRGGSVRELNGGFCLELSYTIFKKFSNCLVSDVTWLNTSFMYSLCIRSV